METTCVSRTLAGRDAPCAHMHVFPRRTVRSFVLVRKRGFSGGQVEGLVCSQAGVRLFLRSGGVFTLFASNPSTGNVSSP